jgi:hypothetical protein
MEEVHPQITSIAQIEEPLQIGLLLRVLRGSA